MNTIQDESLVERLVTYMLEFEGKFYHKTILGHAKPRRVMETPVFEYTEMALHEQPDT